MIIKTTDNKKIIINDEIAYQKYLEAELMLLQKKANTTGLSQEETVKVNDIMYMLNQIVDQLRETKEETSTFHR